MRNGKVSVVELPTTVDVLNGPKVIALLRAEQSAGQLTLALDAGKTEFLDSIFLGALVRLFNELKIVGAKVLFVRPGERVRRLLALTKLDEVFTILDE